ncbi:MAG: T9SS type A sorting domain-containing protein [Bacteroidetes bacterium]|nr:T9SS type A sorting domain-containing protein [Bacteroidota bacterium]
MLGGTIPLSIDGVSGLMTGLPNTAGYFVVSQKVDEYRNGNLINTMRREFVIAVNYGYYSDLSGNVSVNNGTQNLDIGKAWLIQLNLLDSTLTAVDTNEINNGSYLHSQAINGVYRVKASADSISPFYASNIPTYYGDVLFWYDATPVFLCITNLSGVNINLVQGINPGGPGFVGGLISQGANRTSTVAPNLGGITVILYNQLYQPVAYAITDTNGLFGISNLPFGNYKVFIDRLNYNVDNNLAPTINVNTTNPVTNNLTFLLHDTWLEYTGAVGQEEITENQAKLIVYPNPVASELTLSNANLIPVGTEYAIFNVFGEEMVKGKLNSNQINVESLSPQIYILRIATVNKFEYLKFVRK